MTTNSQDIFLSVSVLGADKVGKSTLISALTSQGKFMK